MSNSEMEAVLKTERERLQNDITAIQKRITAYDIAIEHFEHMREIKHETTNTINHHSVL